ncbi:MAG: hypothetical protein MUF35_00355 [Candidatus Nanopelagicales bacterium]|jgi:hypothetical protein|nr:hypothetical protein [Candidatus Nanopelagicales bacterium]
MVGDESAAGPDRPTAPVPRPLAPSDAQAVTAPDARPTQVLGTRDPVAPPPAIGGPAAPERHDTTRIDPGLAGAQADPFAATTVLARGDHQPVTPGTAADPGAGPPPALLSRRAAAELGVYVGAGLAVLAVAGVAVRGWADWASGMRAAAVALTSVALLATGLFVRLPWSRRPGDERRRAVSALLAAGMGLVCVASGVALDVRQGTAAALGLAHGLACVLAMLLVAAVARTPLTELAVLGAGAWAAWVLVPSGPWTWVAMVGLGSAWALVGWRVARGRRTAVVAGVGLALVGSVGMATQAALAWPVRGVLGALAVGGLLAFLRGGPAPWLALGAASATALAASVANDQLGPAPALLVGGVATMVVSAIALHGARRAG